MSLQKCQLLTLRSQTLHPRWKMNGQASLPTTPPPSPHNMKQKDAVNHGNASATKIQLSSPVVHCSEPLPHSHLPGRLTISCLWLP